MKLFKFILKIIVEIIVAFIIIFFGTIAFKTIDPFKIGFENPDFFKVQPYIVETGSMSPTLEVNDVVFVYNTKDRNEYKEGQIAMYVTEFYGNTYNVVHRIKSFNADGTVTMRGDANNVDDDPIPFSYIKARYIFHIPKLGAVIKFMQENPIVLGIALVAYIALVFIFGGKNDDKDKKNSKKKTKKGKGEPEGGANEKSDININPTLAGQQNIFAQPIQGIGQNQQGPQIQGGSSLYNTQQIYVNPQAQGGFNLHNTQQINVGPQIQTKPGQEQVKKVNIQKGPQIQTRPTINQNPNVRPVQQQSRVANPQVKQVQPQVRVANPQVKQVQPQINSTQPKPQIRVQQGPQIQTKPQVVTQKKK